MGSKTIPAEANTFSSHRSSISMSKVASPFLTTTSKKLVSIVSMLRPMQFRCKRFNANAGTSLIKCLGDEIKWFHSIVHLANFTLPHTYALQEGTNIFQWIVHSLYCINANNVASHLFHALILSSNRTLAAPICLSPFSCHEPRTKMPITHPPKPDSTVSNPCCTSVS